MNRTSPNILVLRSQFYKGHEENKKKLKNENKLIKEQIYAIDRALDKIKGAQYQLDQRMSKTNKIIKECKGKISNNHLKPRLVCDVSFFANSRYDAVRVLQQEYHATLVGIRVEFTRSAYTEYVPKPGEPCHDWGLEANCGDAVHHKEASRTLETEAIEIDLTKAPNAKENSQRHPQRELRQFTQKVDPDVFNGRIPPIALRQIHEEWYTHDND